MPFSPISERSPLILASASPRRKALLAQVGIPFLAVPSLLEESTLWDDPSETAASLAREKALRVWAARSPWWVMGADTIVVLDRQVLGKPQTSSEAHKMLSLLQGREHTVVTGFCVLDPSGAVAHSEVVSTTVCFKPLTLEEIQAYVATGEPFGKAGAYAIQGIGAFMAMSISGSYFNVVGLPVAAVIQALLKTGALRTFPVAPS